MRAGETRPVGEPTERVVASCRSSRIIRYVVAKSIVVLGLAPILLSSLPTGGLKQIRGLELGEFFRHVKSKNLIDKPTPIACVMIAK